MSESVRRRVECQLGQTRNSKVLASFIAYCQQYPDQRFWQALRNWCGMPFVIVSALAPHDILASHCVGVAYDTFYWEGIGTNVPEPDERLDRHNPLVKR